jgi:hypothetical protein
MEPTLLVYAVAGSSAVAAIAWMVVRLSDARALKEMLLKAIEDCPPEKRPANIKAIGQLASQMSRDHPPGRIVKPPGVRRRRH